MLMVLEDGTVVNKYTQKELENQRQTADQVVVRDEVRVEEDEEGRPVMGSRRRTGTSGIQRGQQATSPNDHNPKPSIESIPASIGRPKETHD